MWREKKKKKETPRHKRKFLSTSERDGARLSCVARPFSTGKFLTTSTERSKERRVS